LRFCFSSRRRHTRSKRDWSSDVCSSDLVSDYTRYLPKATGPKIAFWTTYTGLVGSSVFVMILGVLLGTVAPGNPLGGLSSQLGTLGLVVLVIFAITSAIINGVELYSAVMNGLTVL